MSTPAIQLHQRFENDPCRGFATPADFIGATINEARARHRDDVVDMRLRSLCARDSDDRQSAGELAFLLPSGFAPRAAVGSDEQGEYSWQYGGAVVPPPAVLPGALSAPREACFPSLATRGVP